MVGHKQQGLEFGTVGLTPCFLIGIHLIDSTVLFSERAELVQLVLGGLPFVFGRHPGINRYAHAQGLTTWRQAR